MPQFLVVIAATDSIDQVMIVLDEEPTDQTLAQLDEHHDLRFIASMRGEMYADKVIILPDSPLESNMINRPFIG